MMGRESHAHDPTVVHSSIALLQERFRQLQRVKEMREERKLLRLLASEPPQWKPTTTTSTYEPATMSFFPTRSSPPPPPPHPHVSLSLWPTSNSTSLSATTFGEAEARVVSMTLRPEASWKKNAYDCDDSDSDCGVDTALHL